jgi:hypothetical protein
MLPEKELEEEQVRSSLSSPESVVINIFTLKQGLTKPASLVTDIFCWIPVLLVE